MNTTTTTTGLPLSLRDVSSRPRFGCKGTSAEAFLASLGLPLPASPNGWAVDDSGRLVGRLATSEFLVEDIGEDPSRTSVVADRMLDPAQRQSGLVPVLRQDRVFELTGPRANELLLQTCNVNFTPLARDARSAAGSLVMTSMIGVGVTIVPRRSTAEVLFTIWTDRSYGQYVWSTLLGIAKELGGGVSAGSGDGGAKAP